MTHGFVRKFYWVDPRDVLADGLVKGGADRTLPHNVSNGCHDQASHEALVCEHVKKNHAGSSTFVLPTKEQLPQMEE